MELSLSFTLVILVALIENEHNMKFLMRQSANDSPCPNLIVSNASANDLYMVLLKFFFPESILIKAKSITTLDKLKFYGRFSQLLSSSS